MDEYQKKAKEFAAYPSSNELQYLTLGLTGEAGEIANKVKKILRGDLLLEDAKSSLVDELGDVLWYLAILADFLDTPLYEVANKNIEKLTSRRERNVIKGSGDNR